uniref:S2 self-incompatibility locus-linked pollen 3.2 protein n=1 Tax=Petunia integrifolia subsp. inflata TaxID=212142 RepID=Q7XAE8_PETIN|nr:S2 self-incompatibility locus-linked pollen 3.2 protein [Petunia integrifolia subsp. inflata]
MDELEFRRLLERFPIVRFRDYHIDSDTSKRSASHSLEQEEVKQWKDAWSKGHKPETEIQSMHRGGAFWGKVREAAEKKILKEKLLAALCTQSGVQYDPSEEVLMAARHIDERQASSVAGPSHRPRSSPYESSSMVSRITRLEEDFDHIRHFQAYQVQHNQAIAEMLRTMALHHGMNMDKFPTCPSYMPPRDKAVLDDDDDDDNDDDEEEDEEEEE